MALAKMRNEILFNMSSQYAHMSINLDKKRIHIYVKAHMYMNVYSYIHNVTHVGREILSKTRYE